MHNIQTVGPLYWPIIWSIAFVGPLYQPIIWNVNGHCALYRPRAIISGCCTEMVKHCLYCLCKFWKIVDFLIEFYSTWKLSHFIKGHGIGKCYHTTFYLQVGEISLMNVINHCNHFGPGKSVSNFLLRKRLWPVLHFHTLCSMLHIDKFWSMLVTCWQIVICITYQQIITRVTYWLIAIHVTNWQLMTCITECCLSLGVSGFDVDSFQDYSQIN